MITTTNDKLNDIIIGGFRLDQFHIIATEDHLVQKVKDLLPEELVVTSMHSHYVTLEGVKNIHDRFREKGNPNILIIHAPDILQTLFWEIDFVFRSMLPHADVILKISDKIGCITCFTDKNVNRGKDAFTAEPQVIEL